jgi:hydroxymethylbilane synthase
MKTLRIGTRSSNLALWQAKTVQQLLQENQVHGELVLIKSAGDIEQDIPLHQMGGVGIFTKALDDALLNNEIDCAVHSCKDLPTVIHESLLISAYLERHDSKDILVCNTKPEIFLNENYPAVIATGSIRRKAQWLSKFPAHEVVNLRGNVESRINKLKASDWDAAIFAYAGLKRLNISPEISYVPGWMLPAPAQGVVAVVCKKTDVETQQHISKLNHRNTEITTRVERDFLRLMEGGCSAPIAALAEIENDKVFLQCSVMNENGSKSLSFNIHGFISEYSNLGKRAYQYAVENGADSILKNLKSRT